MKPLFLYSLHLCNYRGRLMKISKFYSKDGKPELIIIHVIEILHSFYFVNRLQESAMRLAFCYGRIWVVHQEAL